MDRENSPEIGPPANLAVGIIKALRPRQWLKKPTIVGAVVALVTSTGVLSLAAAADDKVVLGGGAGIVVGANFCTLATIGHDHVGDLVGFTAIKSQNPSVLCRNPFRPLAAVAGDGSSQSVAYICRSRA